MNKLRAVIENTKESMAFGIPLLREKERNKREKFEIAFFSLFGGLLWTWITDGLQKEEKN